MAGSKSQRLSDELEDTGGIFPVRFVMRFRRATFRAGNERFVFMMRRCVRRSQKTAPVGSFVAFGAATEAVDQECSSVRGLFVHPQQEVAFGGTEHVAGAGSSDARDACVHGVGVGHLSAQ